MKRIICAAQNTCSSVWISYSAARDLGHLCQLLESSTELMWYIYIILFIPRWSHFVGQSDACNIAMGGLWYPLLKQWRLSNSVLRCIPEWRAVSLDETAFLINIHKFIALIINSLFVIMYFTNLHCQCSTILPNLNGWIFLLEADKTSALSWIARLSCMQNIKLWTSATSSLILYSNLTLGFHLNSTAGTYQEI